MRRRILAATLGVAAAALVIFGVPLGWSVGRVYRSQQLTRLQQAATMAATAVPSEGLHGPDPIEPPPVRSGIQLTYYDSRGVLVAGHGPIQADRHAGNAISGHPSQGSAGSRLVVAMPIIANESPIGSVEASSSAAAVTVRTARAWLVMAALGALALALAALIAVSQSRRLARPVENLVTAADRLGAGDFGLSIPRLGIAELDRAAAAIQSTAVQLGELVNRERAFTAHVSHQLRTPLTALRLDLDNAVLTPGVDARTAVDDAIGQIDRIEETLAELLALARTGETDGLPVALGDILVPLGQRWHPILAEQGRRFQVVVADASIEERLAPTSLAQILDILVDNAAIHGQGTVELTADAGPGWIGVEVSDEGEGYSALPKRSSATHDTRHDGHGVGLPLARSLADGAGGALVLKRSGPRPVIAVLVPSVSNERPLGMPAAPPSTGFTDGRTRTP